MKIIRSAYKRQINCKCGCIFEWDLGDVERRMSNGRKIRYGFNYNDTTMFNEHVINFVFCPECNKEHRINL